MSSDDKVTQLEAQLQKAKADRAARKAAEKVAAEAKQVTEEKAAAEAKEHWRAVEAKACWIAEEKAMAAVAVVRRQAILDAEARCQAETEEVVAEPDGRSLSKQKERAEGEQVMCNRCVTWGAEC